MIKKEKLCPFDKEPCIRDNCAVWAENEELCSFALIPYGGKQVIAPLKPREKPVSSGLSGRYRDPLFD